MTDPEVLVEEEDGLVEVEMKEGNADNLKCSFAVFINVHCKIVKAPYNMMPVKVLLH